MPSDPIVYGGVDISPGRKPVTFAALDNDLSILSIEHWTIAESLSCISHYENMWLCFHCPSRPRGRALYAEFKKQILEAGFQHDVNKGNTREWLETSAQDCFAALIRQKPLPRRTLEGRLQRTAILYEQGLQIPDPMDIFEEITLYKLTQGILPLENIFSSPELDALAAAYLAWMAVNQPGQVVAQGEFVLPAQE